jgi:uncharacterized protein (DUF1697 family)
MKTYISLLRGINVSVQNRIRMPELQRLYESLHLGNVVTYIQSGNVIFDCAEKESVTVARAIESKLEGSFGLSVRVLVRDTSQFQEIIENNVFVNQRKEDPEKLHVTFLAEVPGEKEVRNIPVSGWDCHVGKSTLLASTLDSMAGNNDEYMISGQEIYLFCPNGYGKTKLSNSFFEKKLKVAATTRNWKTVNALYEIANQRRVE